MSDQKICTKCKIKKDITGFHLQPTGPMGRHSWCRDCINQSQRELRIRHYTKEQKRKWLLSSRYKITPDQFERMMTDQKGLCGICKKIMVKPHIDHDHQTKKVRGLLCHGCNIKLPGVENKEYFYAAFSYLAEHISL